MNDFNELPVVPKTEESADARKGEELNIIAPEADDDRPVTEAEIRRAIDIIVNAAVRLPVPVVREVYRPFLQDMAPDERRDICAGLQTCMIRSDGKRTGAFFNAMRGIKRSGATDDKELGRRIMAKRNPHCKPEK